MLCPYATNIPIVSTNLKYLDVYINSVPYFVFFLWPKAAKAVQVSRMKIGFTYIFTNNLKMHMLKKK